jgi:hypothetical protein
MATINELFDMAIAAERTAERLYLGLEKKFSHCEDVAAFWAKSASEEIQHATWLESLRARINEKRLADPADSEIVRQAERVAEFSVEDALADVRNLQDAYVLANDAESSETNTIFEFLIGNFADDERTQIFLRTQLKNHIGNLMIDFPTRFNTRLAREAIKAR